MFNMDTKREGDQIIDMSDKNILEKAGDILGKCNKISETK